MRRLLIVLVAFFSLTVVASVAQAGKPSRGVPYEVKIISPAGGEEWFAGESHGIVWSLSGFPSDAVASIYYTMADGGMFQTIVKNYPADKMSYLWDIPKDLGSGKASEKYVIWIGVTRGKTTVFKISSPFSISPPPPIWVQRVCVISETQVPDVSDVQNDAYVGVNIEGVIDGQTRQIYALAPFFFQSQLSGLKVYGGRVLSAMLLEFFVPDNIADPCGIEPESVGSMFYVTGIVAIDRNSSYLSGSEGYGKSSGQKNPFELFPQK